MDAGLGEAASVIAVIQLTASVVKYINTAVGATKDRVRLRDKVRSCEYMLQQLNDRASDSEESTAWADSVRALEGPGAPLGRLQVALLEVKKRLEPKQGLEKLTTSLRWPFSEKDMDKILLTIDREKSLLAIALTNDCRKLLEGNKRRLWEISGTVGKNALLLEETR